VHLQDARGPGEPKEVPVSRSLWDYRTLDWIYAHPEAKVRPSQRLQHPSRCRQDGRSLTVLIDGGDPFRPEVKEVDQALVLQEIEQLQGLRFLIPTTHLISAKYLIRTRSEEQVRHARRWLRLKDPAKRDCEAAKAAIRVAREPYCPNLTIVHEFVLPAPQAAVRLGGDGDTVLVPLP
jgi:hypothetical protein